MGLVLLFPDHTKVNVSNKLVQCLDRLKGYRRKEQTARGLLGTTPPRSVAQEGETTPGPDTRMIQSDLLKVNGVFTYP